MNPETWQVSSEEGRKFGMANRFLYVEVKIDRLGERVSRYETISAGIGENGKRRGGYVHQLQPTSDAHNANGRSAFLGREMSSEICLVFATVRPKPIHLIRCIIGSM